MSSLLSAAVVGGGMGGRLSMDALVKSERFHLAAAADLRPEVRSALETDYPGIRTFATHEEMFAQCPTDVVCVSTYPPSHEAVTVAALQIPSLRGILVEKPLGDTAAAGRRILDAIRLRGLPVVVPHGLRARATPMEIMARVRRGDIGDLKLIEVQCDKWDLLNAGIHWLDFCLAATGERQIVSVMAAGDISTRTFRDGMQVETEAVTYVVNEDRVRFIVQTGDYINVNAQGRTVVFRLVGSCGLIEFWGWPAGYFIVNKEHPGGSAITPEELPSIGHQRHLENLAAQIESEAPDYAAPESSLAALEICEAAFLSYKHRCKIEFPLSRFVPQEVPDWAWGQPYAGSGGGRDGRKLEPLS